MQQTSILYPLFAIVLLSVVVGLRMLQLRLRAVARDGLSGRYFQLNQGGKLPPYLIQAEQHYSNLYETPVMFYAIVVLVYVLKMTTPVSLALAWAYIAIRMGHAYVHMGQNRLSLRRNFFLASIVVLVALWAYVLLGLLQR